MNVQKKIIVGYDARVGLQQTQKDWGKERRSQYLYQEDVLVPLSTDCSVWKRLLEPSPEELPFTGHQMLWANFEALKFCLSKNAGSYTEHHLILAIEIILGKEKEDEVFQWQELTASVIPRVLNRKWAFLGYDVSDKWLLSALSNCGFLPEFEDVILLKEKWKTELNKYHLFKTYQKAVEFKEFSNIRVSEHAPFYVFGLWFEDKCEN